MNKMRSSGRLFI